MKPQSAVLALGLGNMILCDDSVGVRVVRLLQEHSVRLGFETAEAELAGFALLDILAGYDGVVVVDAIRLPDRTPGEVVSFDPREQTPSLHLVSGHQIDLPAALELGRALGLTMPRLVRVVGVQIEDDRSFCEDCTPAVAAAIPEAVTAMLACIAEMRRAV